jgi:hypothetical protein
LFSFFFFFKQKWRFLKVTLLCQSASLLNTVICTDSHTLRGGGAEEILAQVIEGPGMDDHVNDDRDPKKQVK